MAALQMKYLLELEEYLSSGNLEEDFQYSPEERRHEILEFLEKLMDVAELADQSATRLIFKGINFSGASVAKESVAETATTQAFPSGDKAQK